MLCHIQPALTMPMSARKKTRIGISKIMPMPTMSVRNSELYSQRDHRLEVFAIADQKHERLWEDHFVAEISSGQKQPYGREHEGQDVALFVAVKAGRNKAPDLVEDEGRGDEQSRHQPDFQIQIERLGGIDVHELGGKTIARERLHDGTLHDSVDALGVSPAGEKADDDGDGGINDALAQFLEMVEEAHGGHLILVVIRILDGSVQG